MGEIMSECDPPVLRLPPNRYRGRWEVGVMKSTDCNADTIWPNVGLPKHRRSARRTKMHPNLSSLLPVADIDVGRSFGANMFLLEKGTHAEHRTGSPLTLATMADAYNIRIGGYFDAQGTATAMRGSRHDTLPCRMRGDYRRAAVSAIETGSVDPAISVKPSSYIHPEHPQDEPSREHI